MTMCYFNILLIIKIIGLNKNIMHYANIHSLLLD